MVARFQAWGKVLVSGHAAELSVLDAGMFAELALH